MLGLCDELQGRPVTRVTFRERFRVFILTLTYGGGGLLLGRGLPENPSALSGWVLPLVYLIVPPAVFAYRFFRFFIQSARNRGAIEKMLRDYTQRFGGILSYASQEGLVPSVISQQALLELTAILAEGMNWEEGTACLRELDPVKS